MNTHAHTLYTFGKSFRGLRRMTWNSTWLVSYVVIDPELQRRKSSYGQRLSWSRQGIERPLAVPCKPQDVPKALRWPVQVRLGRQSARRGRTQVKPGWYFPGECGAAAAAGFGLQRVVYIVVDTSGAQACHVRVEGINVNVKVNAKARHSDPESPRALTSWATLSTKLNSLCENNDGLS